MPDDRAVILSREVIKELTQILSGISTESLGLTKELVLLEPLVGPDARRRIRASRESLGTLDKFLARYSAIVDQL